MSLSVGVTGYRGYSGAELVRLLSHHPANPEIVLLDHREPVGDGPRYLRPSGPRHTDLRAAMTGPRFDVVFLATPHEVSAELVPQFLETGAKVVDLSGAFRLKSPEARERWYPGLTVNENLAGEAAYGLPEFHRESIREARLVANPGCYPTAANLAIRPLREHGIADLHAGIVCDAKSGVSGAGRKASLTTSFCEVTENFSAYALLNHRHVPEVLVNSELKETEFSFSAQLIPVERGILETIYFRAAGPWSEAEILATYERCYGGEPFVRLHAPGSTPDLRGVTRTNFCDIAVRFDEKTGRGVIVSAIDNLGKGAAGQAVQNMNLLLGLPETAGLL